MQGVRVYSVECNRGFGFSLFGGKPATPATPPDNFWTKMASRSHGKYLKLENFPTIVDIFMAICFREVGAEYFDVSITVNIIC